MKRKVVGVIPARVQSTRLPRKLLLDLGGKSVLERTYEKALNSGALDALCIATEDEEIQKLAGAIGAPCILTPSAESGTERIGKALLHPFFDDVDGIVNIQGDEPFIDLDALKKVADSLRNSNEDMVTCCTPIENAEDAQSTHIVKCALSQEGYALYFSRSPIPFGKGPLFKHIGIYGYRKHFLINYLNTPSTPLQMSENLEQLKALEMGAKIKVELVHNCQGFGIDIYQDLVSAREKFV